MGIHRVCVFCGSKPGIRPAYQAQAQETGRLLARRGIGLVYGGASVGTMGVLADAALASGGQVIGVMPTSLVEREIAHRGLSELHEVASMHERKALMVELSDAFLVLPGGSGTLDELFEVFTWAQLGFHAKPIALVDIEGYYRPLMTFIDRAVAEGFIAPAHRAMFQVEPDVASALSRLLSEPA